MSYGLLLKQVETTGEILNASGIGRGDPVAIVLDNGPHMVAAFLAVGSVATVAPLHPGFRKQEFLDALDSLKAKALIIQSDSDTVAASAATELDIPLLPLIPVTPAGGYTLEPRQHNSASNPGLARGEDIALLLHTSGTTARPKLVPLTQSNLTTSARNIATTLQLTPTDTCLNIMPMFHIHGLIGAALSSFFAGASVAASSGFSALRFFKWLNTVRPSWYTAVPTMHQTILQRAKHNQDVIATSNLRLIRSSSAALAPQILHELESTFNCRAIESYGMTEASHQMSSNPLPPSARKPGTVGTAAGPSVAVMDMEGNLLQSQKTGEVVVKGDNIMSGYLDNPQANADSFMQGWFRTGDQGFLDADGYLTITGRLKELINQGGEKISPREIDEVLLDHPSVEQAVAFAAPHDKLGEAVIAAVVLAEGKSATQRELREFAASRLADFKVPRQVVFLDKIPKGPSGKLKRVGLAQDLGLA